MKKLFACLVLTLVVSTTHAGDSRPVLLELFTSEGCSSCPAGEKVVRNLSERPEVFALSYHVDYWDRHGWKDPFATQENTNRQKKYMHAFKNNRLYTPQVVVDGVEETTGSWGWRVKMLMHKVTKTMENLPIHIRKAGDQYEVTLPKHSGLSPADIWFITYNPVPKISRITSGDNKGKNMQHVNVVTSIDDLGLWIGSKSKVRITKQIPKNHKVAVILQQTGLKNIYGFSRL